MEMILEIIAALVLLLNAYATWHVVKATELEAFQKYAQTAIIWVIPLVGAGIVIYILNDSNRTPPPPKLQSGGGGNDSMPGGVQ